MRQNDTYQTTVAATQTRRKKATGTSRDVSGRVQTTTQKAYRTKRPVGKMMLFGAMSIAAYAFVFANETLVTQTFTLGGWHAAFPVVTAFAFSFIHGAFASNLLSVVGLEAKK